MEKTVYDRFKDLLCFLKSHENEYNIFIYGAGTYGKIISKLFFKENIKWKGFLDKNRDKIHSAINNKMVYSVEETGKKSIILISLSSQIYKNDICALKKFFKCKGIDERNILSFDNDYEIVDFIIEYITDCSGFLEKNKNLHNLYANKRCFIIGNGPSLTIRDLEKLNNEVTMACNGIAQLYNQTKWRPTYFFCEDNIFIDQNIKCEADLIGLLNNSKGVFTTLRNDLWDRLGLKYKDLYYLYAKRATDIIDFSDDISKKIYSAGTTLYSMFQVAVYMGIKQIYLLGVDFSFHKTMTENGKTHVNDGIKNHMSLMDEVTEGVYRIDIISKGYDTVKQYADSHGIKIYNATRGGKLEVFERVDFDCLWR